MVNRDKRFVPSIPNRPKDNQRDTAIDMFTLARTRKILGNSSSSFSQVAAEIGGIRVFRVLEEKQDRAMRRALRFSGKTWAAVSSATYWRPKGLKRLIRRRKLRPLVRLLRRRLRLLQRNH